MTSQPEVPPTDPLTTLDGEIVRHWADALSCWSLLTQLREPEIVDDGQGGAIAYIRLRDARIVFDRKQIVELDLVPFTKTLLAHEIGHHVYVPGNFGDHLRMLAAMAPVLVGLPKSTLAMVANLYSDLLINDRLVRRSGLDLAAVYRRLKEKSRASTPESKTWTLYMRICEHLWRTPTGFLTSGVLDAELEGDALLLSRLIRNFASDWLRGCKRFAGVFVKYLHEDKDAAQEFAQRGLGDLKEATGGAGDGDSIEIPDGLTEDGDGDSSDDLDLPDRSESLPQPTEQHATASGQARTPFQYLQLLQMIGLSVDENRAIARYYRERALPHLIPFPSERAPRSKEQLPEGTVPWEAGEDLADLDLPGSLQQSPVVIPGVTTVQRVYGEAPGHDPSPLPMDLDIYIDCSGSMPNPKVELSYLTLAATILALSALRAGASVQATLWAHAGAFHTTKGFLRDERRLLDVVTGYLSGGTAFPLHILRDTFATRGPERAPAHVVVISDDGVNTMLQPDEKQRPGAEIVAEALARARGGCTLVLNLPGAGTFSGREELERLGCRIYGVQRWEELIAFARAFVRQTYARP